MGMFDEIKGKAEELLHGHSDKVEELSDQGIQKATDAADGATGGKSPTRSTPPERRPTTSSGSSPLRRHARAPDQ
jgi:hypothetical protein